MFSARGGGKGLKKRERVQGIAPNMSLKYDLSSHGGGGCSNVQPTVTYNGVWNLGGGYSDMN